MDLLIKRIADKFEVLTKVDKYAGYIKRHYFLFENVKVAQRTYNIACSVMRIVPTRWWTSYSCAEAFEKNKQPL